MYMQQLCNVSLFILFGMFEPFSLHTLFSVSNFLIFALVGYKCKVLYYCSQFRELWNFQKFHKVGDISTGQISPWNLFLKDCWQSLFKICMIQCSSVIITIKVLHGPHADNSADNTNSPDSPSMHYTDVD